MSIEKELLKAVHEKGVFKRRVKVLSRLLSDQICEGKSVLDLGCGDGSIAKSIMDNRPNLEIRGIDVLRRPEVLIAFDLFDGKTIPFPDRAFDWVTVVDVLHHTDDPQDVLTEAARVARLGVVVKDHLREGIGAYSTLRFMDWVGNRGHDVRLPYNYLSKSEWNQAIAGARLSVKTWETELNLYPTPFNLFFDRQLHFLATLMKESPTDSSKQ
jgi:2-polyprenyl-3-methyl-5-hydroxy-6-metoxy-1,4-benzoquinol methylase